MPARPTPEITAVEVCAALSPTAPPDVVIAIDPARGRAVVTAAADLRHWRTGAWTALIVATRPEITAALPSDARTDIDAIDAYAHTLTDHAAHLLTRPHHAA